MQRGNKHIVIDARNRRSSTGRYTDRLVENLQKIDKDNKYTILVEADDDWKMKNYHFSTVVANFQQFSFNPLEQINFNKLLKNLKPDLVHFTMTQQPLLYSGKVVTTTHDMTMFNYTRPSRFPAPIHSLGMELYKYLFRKSHEKAAKIIVPSKYVAKALAGYQPSVADKIEITYEASDPPSTLRSMAVKGVNKPFILHVGAPYPHKNIEKLIQSFDLLQNNNPDLQLVLPGKMKDQFKSDFENWLSKSKNKDSIIAPGFVNEPELKWLYENASCYVFPSLSEGFGLPGLEAMAHGCPVVSSNATCLPEVYGNAAHYFNPEDVTQITQAVEDVLSNKTLREKLISDGKKQLEKYSWETMAKQTLKIYQNLLP